MAAEQPTEIYRSYRIRWVVLFVLAIVNGTNAFIWISYSPVANHFVEFYSTSELFLNMLSIIFPMASVVLGFPAAFLMSKLGIRFVLLFSTFSHILCGALRCVSHANWNISSVTRISLLMVGQVFAALAQPLCMFSTTTLAFEWFSDNQRTIANTIASMGNAVGVLLGSALAPVIVKNARDIPNLNYVILALVIVEFITVLVLIRRSKPPTPPSAASAISRNDRSLQSSEVQLLRSFVNYLKMTISPLKICGFWLVFLTFSFSIGYFTTLSTLFEQILCTKGYSNEFAGFCGSVIIAAGVLVAGPVAVYVDKSGRLLETVKISFSLGVLGAVCLSIILWYPNQQYAISVFVIILGAFGFSQYSLSLELAAEATFPIPESTSTSMLIIGSQLFSVVIVPVMQVAAPVVNNSTSIIPSCGPSSIPQDYTIPNMVLCCLMTLLAIVQLFTMKLPYNRRNLSTSLIIPNNPDQNAILSSSSSSIQNQNLV